MSRASHFELWVKACQEFNTLMYCLEGEKDHALYKTTTERIVGGSVFYDTPVFHVWIHGQQVLTTTNYIEAVRKWEAEK